MAFEWWWFVVSIYVEMAGDMLAFMSANIGAPIHSSTATATSVKCDRIQRGDGHIKTPSVFACETCLALCAINTSVCNELMHISWITYFILYLRTVFLRHVVKQVNLALMPPLSVDGCLADKLFRGSVDILHTLTEIIHLKSLKQPSWEFIFRMFHLIYWLHSTKGSFYSIDPPKRPTSIYFSVYLVSGDVLQFIFHNVLTARLNVGIRKRSIGRMNTNTAFSCVQVCERKRLTRQ